MRKPAIAPPGKKQRDYRRKGREGEKTVYSRSQFLISLFPTQQISAVIRFGAAREGEPDVCLVCE